MWRAYIQADDIPKFLNEEWIYREFRVLLPTGLYAEGPPDSVHGQVGKMSFAVTCVHNPVCPTLRFGLQSFLRQRSDPLVRVGAWTARFEFIVKPLDAVLKVALAPKTDRLLTQIKLLSKLPALVAAPAAMSTTEALKRRNPSLRGLTTLSSFQPIHSEILSAILDQAPS